MNVHMKEICSESFMNYHHRHGAFLIHFVILIRAVVWGFIESLIWTNEQALPPCVCYIQ